MSEMEFIQGMSVAMTCALAYFVGWPLLLAALDKLRSRAATDPAGEMDRPRLVGTGPVTAFIAPLINRYFVVDMSSSGDDDTPQDDVADVADGVAMRSAATHRNDLADLRTRDIKLYAALIHESRQRPFARGIIAEGRVLDIGFGLTPSGDPTSEYIRVRNGLQAEIARLQDDNARDQLVDVRPDGVVVHERPDGSRYVVSPETRAQQPA